MDISSSSRKVLPHNVAEEIHSPTETGRHYAAAEANTAEKSESKVGEERKKPPCSCVVVCFGSVTLSVWLVLQLSAAAVLCQSPVPSAAQYHHRHTEKCSILAACLLAPTTFQHSSSVQCAEGFFAAVPARIEHHWIQSPSLLWILSLSHFTLSFSLVDICTAVTPSTPPPPSSSSVVVISVSTFM